MKVLKQDTHKRAERLQQLASAKGAFKSQRPRTQAIDLELLELQRRETSFNESIRKELLKLNFPLLDKPPIKPKKRPESHFQFSLLTSLKAKSPKISKTPLNVKRKKTRHTTFAGFSRKNTTDLPTSQPLPALVKSVPIHLDPRLRYAKVRKLEGGKDKLFRLNSINSIISSLQQVDKTSPERFDESLEVIRGRTKSVSQCVSALCESTRFGVNTSLETIVQLQNDATRLNQFILTESNKMTLAVYN
jgi:hypothetical protein